MKFSRPRTYLSLLSVGIILGIVGSSGVYWLFFAPKDDRQSMDTETHYSTSVDQPNVRGQNAYDVVPRSSLPPLPTLDRLEDLEEIRSPFDRELALQILLVNSDETQVAKLLSQSKNLSTIDIKQEAQRAIVQRLAQLNPSRALSRVLAVDSQHSQDRLMVTVFEEWAHSGPSEAIAQAQVLNESRRDSALRTILRERSDLLDETRRSIAAEVGNDQIAVEVLLEERVERALEDPEAAWQKLALDLQDDPMLRSRLAQVALSWIEKDGMGVMERISTSLTNLQARRDVVLGILQELASSNPSETFQYAMTMENDLFDDATRKVLEVWAWSDPRSALAAVSGIEEKTLRETFEVSIAYRWIDKEPREVLEAIDALPGHVHVSATQAAITKIAENFPQEAAALVAEMESGNTREFTAWNVARIWMFHDPKAVLDWILNEPAIQDIKRWLLDSTLYQIAQADPKLAMDAALAEPLAEGEMGLEGMVIGAAARSDLDAAIELLPQVRKGPTAIDAYREVAAALIRNGDVDEALNLVQQTPDSKRPYVYAGLVQAWAFHDPAGLLTSMNQLPSKEVKSIAARRLLEINRNRGDLTNEQVQQARKFLTEEDSKALDETEGDTLLRNVVIRVKR